MSYAQFTWSRLVFIFGSNLLKHVQRCYDLGSRNLQMTNTAAQVGNPWKWTLNCPCSEVLEDDENTLVVKKLASLIRPRWSSDQFCTICSQSEWTIVKNISKKWHNICARWCNDNQSWQRCWQPILTNNPKSFSSRFGKRGLPPMKSITGKGE